MPLQHMARESQVPTLMDTPGNVALECRAPQYSRVNFPGNQFPMGGRPSNWPSATMTFPRRITVVGQPSTCQPSHGL